MQTTTNDCPEKRANGGCCGCGCGAATTNTQSTQEKPAERRESAELPAQEDSCCGG